MLEDLWILCDYYLLLNQIMTHLNQLLITDTSLTWEDVSDMIKSDTDTKCQSSLSTIQPSHKKYWQDKGLWWLWLY